MIARRQVGYVDRNRSYLSPIPAGARPAVEVLQGIAEIIAPSFLFKLPPQAMGFKKAYISTSTFYFDGAVPSCCLKDACRELKSILVAGHIIPPPRQARALTQ